MKKVLLSLLIAAASSMFAQNTAKEIFTTKSLVWYGINFSQGKLVGQFDQAMGAGAATPEMLKTKWMSGWNSLVISEPKKYKIKETFRADDVYFDIGPTEKQNQTINSGDLMSFNAFTFKDAQKSVSDAVSKLTGGEKTEGIGVVFIVESFNKLIDEASVYVTFFDIKTKKILITEKYIGKPMGIGLRNFWAGAINHILKQADDDYSKWKSKNK